MLVRIAKRRGLPDVADLLLDCHERIRTFTAMAVRLAAAVAPAEREVREAAGAIRRYFTEAFPLHVADEDEDITPALFGRDPAVDAALAALSAEHLEHREDVAHLVDLCAELEREPRLFAARSGSLAVLAVRLEKQLGAHLEREEREVLPVVRALPQGEREALRARMRARRTHGSAG